MTSQVFAKPGCGEARDFLERTGFGKEMSGMRNDRQRFFAAQFLVSEFIQAQDFLVAFADDEEGGCGDVRQSFARKIWTTPS